MIFLEKSLEFLNFMYKNSLMGIVGIDNVIMKVKTKKMKELLQKQKVQYEDICNQAKEILKRENFNINEIGPLTRLGTSFMSSLEITMDKTDSCIAKMMIEGTNKGIIEINKKLNEISNIDKQIFKIAKSLLATEQNNLNELKKFL